MLTSLTLAHGATLPRLGFCPAGSNWPGACLQGQEDGALRLLLVDNIAANYWVDRARRPTPAAFAQAPATLTLHAVHAIAAAELRQVCLAVPYGLSRDDSEASQGISGFRSPTYMIVEGHGCSHSCV